MLPCALLLLAAPLPSKPNLHRLPLAEVCALVWAADGSALIAGSDTGEIVVWNPHTGREKARWKAAKPLVALSLRGEVLASGSATGQVQLWQWKTGKPLGAFATAENLRSLCLHPDGQSLAVSAGGQVTRWNPKSGKAIGLVGGEAFEALCVAHSPDGTQLFLTGETRHPAKLGAWYQRVRLKDNQADGGGHGCQFPPPDWLSKPLGHRIAWRPNSTGAVSPGYDALLGGFDGCSVLCSGIGAVAGLAFTPEGKYLIVATAEGQILRVDYETQQRDVIAEKLGRLTQFALSPDGKAYAVADGRHVSIRSIGCNGDR